MYFCRLCRSLIGSALARTRWEMEATGKLSLEGCIELAWVMGFIAQSPTGQGWVDAVTGASVADLDVKMTYEDRILQHCGIRFIEPDIVGGYDPQRKTLMQAVSVEQDLPPFSVTDEEATQLRLEHKSAVELYRDEGSGQQMARLLRGAVIYVPKALRFDRLVAGLLPTGWDARRFGVPDEIINQVDPVALYTLVSTMEALVSAGITDPYELFAYVHVSEVGNATGSGQGGMRSLKRLYVSRLMDKSVQSDILQGARVAASLSVARLVADVCVCALNRELYQHRVGVGQHAAAELGGAHQDACGRVRDGGGIGGDWCGHHLVRQGQGHAGGRL